MDNIQISLPAIGEEELLAVQEPLKSGWITQGPKVAEFESAFAERHGVDHAFAVTSCTTGLHLALAALEIGPGDEVIVPAFTWVATANVVLYCGATPVFADVEPGSFNLDLDHVSSVLTDKTKAVVAVHLFGLCVDVPALRKMLPDGVAVVEDAACAAGAAFGNVSAGALGDVGVFSFHPRKTITTGEGGMVTTNDDSLAERLEQLRNHGATVSEEQRHHGPKPYVLPDFNMLGFNYRMTDLQGAVGLIQLSRLDGFLEERNRWANWYTERFEGLTWLRVPQVAEYATHGWQAYVLRLIPEAAPVSRNELMERLQAKGIATRPGTHAVHMLGLYKDKYGFRPDDFPVAAMCNDQTMAIPLHNRMTEEQFDYVAAAILELG